MAVRDVDVSRLNEAEYNPRMALEPGMPEWEKLKTSIETFGNVEPVVWNERTGNVVGGHQRLAVLKSLGYTSVPCSVVDLNETDEKVLNVALNKIKGQWDYKKLEEILSEFDSEVATASGFSAEEIAVILASNEDLIDGEEEYGDWINDFDDVVGGNYVVTLLFANPTLAAQWINNERLDGEVRPNSSSAIIGMGD